MIACACVSRGRREEGGTQCPTAAHTCVFVSKDNVCESSQICELEAENVRRKGSAAKIA